MKNVIRIAWIFIFCFRAQSVFAEEQVAAVELASERVPRSVRFRLAYIKDGEYELAGSISLTRQFLGTRATPSFRDKVVFRCFNGEELPFSTFSDLEVEQRFVKQLQQGRRLPVVMRVRFESKSVGHDGLNTHTRRIAHIEDCTWTDAEAICSFAALAGYSPEDILNFKASLAPDYLLRDIACSLGKVSVRAEGTPRAAAVAIQGLRIFNPSSQEVKVEIIRVEVEQQGEKQACSLSKKSRALTEWVVDAGSWSDGNYEEGKMPQTVWMYDSSGVIEAGEEVLVEITLRLNDADPFTLKRSVQPL